MIRRKTHTPDISYKAQKSGTMQRSDRLSIAIKEIAHSAMSSFKQHSATMKFTKSSKKMDSSNNPKKNASINNDENEDFHFDSEQYKLNNKK